MSGEEDCSEDEEYSTFSVLTARGPIPVDNPPTTADPVDGQSVTPGLVSDISSIAQPLLPHETLDSMDSEHKQEPESDDESETDSKSDSKKACTNSPKEECQKHKRHTSSVLWTGTNTQYNHI